MTNNISVYVHIPFCVHKCTYCAFYSLVGSKQTKDLYTKALIDEISAFVTDKKVKTVYLGGGTPPVIGTVNLLKVLEAIKSHFALTSDCSITCEVNPCTVNLDTLKALRGAGVNRLSVGVQSLVDDELKLMGRTHSAAEALSCIADARKAGFDDVSADLIFGYPTQTTESIKRSLAIANEVEHVSIYSLQVEPHTVLYNTIKDGDLPTEDEEDAQYRLICDTLAGLGFEHYEVSSFAKKGYRSRHNCVYWQRGEYVGFGAAAHSFYDGRRSYYEDDLNAFIKGAKPITEEVVTPESAHEESIMLGLRMSDGIELSLVDISKAKSFVIAGLAIIKDDRFCLTEQGFRVSNAIIAELI